VRCCSAANNRTFSIAIAAWSATCNAGFDRDTEQRNAWEANGGELIRLPADEQLEMMKMLGSVGEDVSRSKPALHDAYEVVADAARRTQAPSQ